MLYTSSYSQRYYRNESSYIFINTLIILNKHKINYFVEGDTLKHIIYNGHLDNTDMTLSIFDDQVKKILDLQKEFNKSGLVVSPTHNNTVHIYRKSQGGVNTNDYCRDCLFIEIKVYTKYKNCYVRKCDNNLYHNCYYPTLLKENIPSALLEDIKEIYYPQWDVNIKIPTNYLDLLIHQKRVKL